MGSIYVLFSIHAIHAAAFRSVHEVYANPYHETYEIVSLRSLELLKHTFSFPIDLTRRNTARMLFRVVIVLLPAILLSYSLELVVSQYLAVFYLRLLVRILLLVLPILLRGVELINRMLYIIVKILLTAILLSNSIELVV